MNTLVVVAHPNWRESGVQTFLKETTLTMEHITWYDITEHIEHLDILEVQKMMIDADRIIFQFPMYWYGAPSILYLWLEKVLTSDFYERKLKNKELGIVINTGVSAEKFVAGGEEYFSLSEILKPFQATALKCQMIYLPPLHISLFSYLSDTEKKELLIRYQQYLSLHFPTNFRDRENWLIHRLKEMQVRGLIKSGVTEIEELIQLLEENRGELDDLLDTLAEMGDES